MLSDGRFFSTSQSHDHMDRMCENISEHTPHHRIIARDKGENILNSDTVVRHVWKVLFVWILDFLKLNNEKQCLEGIWSEAYGTQCTDWPLSASLRDGTRKRVTGERSQTGVGKAPSVILPALPLTLKTSDTSTSKNAKWPDLSKSAMFSLEEQGELDRGGVTKDRLGWK